MASPKQPKKAAAPPLYEIAKRRVSQRIVLGEWPPGTVIPGEQRLAVEFGMAVGTVRRALAELVQEGMLNRRRKIGTIVTGRTQQHSLRLFFQYFRLHGIDGSLQNSVVRDARAHILPADATIAEKLAIPSGTPVVELRRVRWAAGQPTMIDRYVIAAARIPEFPLQTGRIPDLLFRHLLDVYGIRISAMREELRAEPATRDDRKWLRLKGPAAVLAINAIAFDQTGGPCVLIAFRATTARHRYVNEIM
jgi:GntR family transcriptional regulator